MFKIFDLKNPITNRKKNKVGDGPFVSFTIEMKLYISKLDAPKIC
jgi:hypothetical protein